MKLKKLAAGAALVVGLFGMGSAQAVPVALELSLVIDVSGSINASEYSTQIAGYAAAFNDAGVQAAISSFAGGIAVNVVQFGTNAAEVVGWTHLTSAAEVSAFASVMGSLARNGSIGTSTDIEDGMRVSRLTFAGNGFEGSRLVMDVSGDGVQNTDPSCPAAGPCAATRAERDAAAAAAITINGLAIEGDFGPTGVTDFYTSEVITGGGFVITATSFADFERAAIAKIGREVIVVPEPATLALVGLALAGIGASRRVRKS